MKPVRTWGVRMAEAKLNREYALRMMGVGTLMVGMCVWSLYDGQVAWPRQNDVLGQARPALLATNLTVEAWLTRDGDGRTLIEGVFAAKGSKTPSKLIKKLDELKVPGEVPNKAAARDAQAMRLRKLFENPVYSEHDLTSQFIQAIVTLALGILAFASLARKAGKRFVADEQALGGSGFGGAVIAYGDIARIDWSKWDEKGIVTLALKSGKSHTLDAWHYAGMSGVVAEIQKQRPDLAPKAGQKS